VQAARKDFGGSIAAYKQAYELAPSDPQAMASVVRSYMAANRGKEALAFLQSVVAASPRNHAARVLQAQLLAQNGNVTAAREALRTAIANDPATPAAYQALAVILMGAGEVNEALSTVERGLQAIPQHFGLRLTRASLLARQGKNDEAIAAYEALIAEHPNAVIAMNNLASLLADHRKDAASIRRAYELAQRFRSTELPHLKDTVGWTAHLAGKTREAADLLKSASAEAPEVPVIQYHYAMNQLALNNTRAAKDALQRSLELAKTSPFPQIDEARKTLERL
jgi:predicted Zn-dependent protease